MPDSLPDPRRDRVNLLLPSPLDRPDLRTALASAERSERREAIAEVEAMESTYQMSSHELAQAICARLGSYRIGIESIAAKGPGYISLDELDPYVGPPLTGTVLNPYTGVLTVDGPHEATSAEALQHVMTAVNDLAPAAELTVQYHASAAMDPTLEVEPEDFTSPDRKEWLEAALATSAPEVMPWGIPHVGAERAWALNVTGRGIAVAVVDTGIAPHEDLPTPVRGFNFIPGSPSYYDDNGHGTHVAGTIAAIRGNGRGVVGVAPQADLVAVKVLARDGYSRGDSVAQGITWAANSGARVINLSLGSPGLSQSMERAILYAQSRHVVVCAAAGNGYGAPVSYPAAFRDICLAVAATDHNNRRATFSNVGPELDISAPGIEVLSCYLANGYRMLQGTSMATPHIAGVVALILSRYPNLTPSQVRDRLLRTALALGAPDQYGAGLVQVDRALAATLLPSGNSATLFAGAVTAKARKSRA